jgi:hypothetical protein
MYERALMKVWGGDLELMTGLTWRNFGLSPGGVEPIDDATVNHAPLGIALGN